MTPDASVIIVSFNTKSLLPRCFESIKSSAGSLSYEVIVVDNASRDGSADFIAAEYPEVILIRSTENLGFAAANNLGFQQAKGRYIVLLNSDAFFVGQAFSRSVELMDQNPKVGLGGAKLQGEDGSWQPSARSFPGLWTELITLLGLNFKWSRSPLFGLVDNTHKDQNAPMYCHWVPGAFSIIRKPILEKIHFFDERFFLYYEEVDLCKRIINLGWKIAYWPELQVIHLGGASTSLFNEKLVTKSGKQMGLWRLQAQYLYHRKHHGWLKARLSRFLEESLNQIRAGKNKSKDPKKYEESVVLLDLIHRAWTNTRGGKVSPPRPWGGV